MTTEIEEPEIETVELTGEGRCGRCGVGAAWQLLIDENDGGIYELCDNCYDDFFLFMQGNK